MKKLNEFELFSLSDLALNSVKDYKNKYELAGKKMAFEIEEGIDFKGNFNL